MKADINRDELVEFLEAIFSEGPETYHLADALENGDIPKGGLIILDKLHSEPPKDSSCADVRTGVQEWISRNKKTRPHLFERNEKQYQES